MISVKNSDKHFPFVSEKYLNEILSKCFLDNIIPIVKYYYDEPHRHYHNWNHIRNGFYLLDEYFNRDIPLHVILAWVFHDIVYQPAIKNNEVASVGLMYHVLKKNNPMFYMEFLKEIKLAEKYILATIDHKILDDDENLSAFLDVDMSYLGMDYDRFLSYREGIRAEYLVVSDTDYCSGSISFCNELLERDKIFHSNYFHLMIEDKCRSNLKKYINKLS